MEQVTKRFMNWASILEDNTRAQVQMTSEMPFIFPHIALMPDAHLGKGCAVGAVIPTLGAIMPAAVGVDIGCLDSDTEFLTPFGWKNISKWDEDDVLVYDPDTDKAWFKRPSQYVVKNCDTFYHFKNSKGLDQMLSEEHRVPVWHGYKERGYGFSVMSPVEVAGKRLDKGYYCSKAAFQSANSDLPVSDDWIRIEVMVQADARVRPSSTGTHVELHFRKARKIERAIQLLDAAGIAFKDTQWGDGTTCITFTTATGCTKDLSMYWGASARQLSVIAQESLKWDGHEGYRSYYSSTNKASADLIQYAFAGSGVRAGMHSRMDNRGEWAENHMVTPTKNEMVGFAEPVLAPSPDGQKYCFTVETGFFVARRNGNIFITGNCGMIAVRTQFTEADLPAPEKRIVLREAIEAAIPLSKGNYNTFIENDHTKIRLQELREAAGNANFDPKSYAGNWEFQLGTLGSGNHFIEVSLDEESRVWLFLHSGSRGIGNRIAMHHIKVAQAECKKWWIDLPDPDLAYLVEGTDEFWAYIRELRWAQRFALLNREEMMDRVIACFRTWVRPDPAVTGVIESERINCHHNYTEKEHHFGKDVWLSRKGAIDASYRTPGLIPGSMGTASYVVEGKGNYLSLSSSPHGAGREYGRKHAQRTFTYDQLVESMEGIEWSGSKEFIDEIPMAYKDIATVMQDASDLVEIKHTLHQIISVKGD